MVPAWTLVFALAIHQSFAAQLCINEVEKWKICMVGSQMKTQVVNAVETCQVERALGQLFLDQQRCIPYKRYIQKRLFGNLKQAGDCLLDGLQWQNSGGDIIPAHVKFGTSHMPVSLTRNITIEAVRQCTQGEMDKLFWKLAGCNYKRKQKTILTNKYKDILPLKCFLHIMGDACAEVAKDIIHVFAEGFLAG